MKNQFLENLKTIPFDADLLESKEYIPIQEAFEYIAQDKNRKGSLLLLDYIESELQAVGDNNDTPIKMLVISEIPNIDEHIRDLALDIMIAVEEEKSYLDLISRIKALKNQVI